MFVLLTTQPGQFPFGSQYGVAVEKAEALALTYQ